MLRRKANLRVRVQDFDFRYQASECLLKFVPGPTGSLTPPAKLPPPHAQHFVSERFQSLLVTGYGVVLEISANHRFQPLRRVLGLLVQTLSQLLPNCFQLGCLPPPSPPQKPPTSQLLPNCFQLGCHALADRLPQHHEVPGLVILPTNVSETQKVKGFRLPFPSLRPPFSGISPKFHQTRLLRMQLQPELPHPFLPFRQELLGFFPVLES